MAFAAIGLGLVVVFAAGLLSLGLTQIRLVDAAAELARQTARGDLDAIAAIEARLPDGAQISLDRDGLMVVVAVTLDMRPWGNWLPPIHLRARAAVAGEGGP
jgi:hypothetical protein